MNASSSASSILIEERLERLARLQGTDPGLFVLAVHSFVEGYLRERCVPEDPVDDRFCAFIGAFKAELIRSASHRFVPGLDVLTLLISDHDHTHQVRHRFAALPADHARIATHHLVRFCSLAGIGEGRSLSRVQEHLAAWNERRSAGDLSTALSQANSSLQAAKDQARKLTERVAELEAVETQFELLKEQRRVLERRIAEAEGGKAAKDERIDELRAERAKLTEELRTLRKRAEELEDAKTYLGELSRMTVYTRTRLDYERMVTRLTQEQRKVLSQISLDADFLVKGAAGTGKTLVLLKAIEKAKGLGTDETGSQDELEMGELGGTVALLTYTTTLVKYDRYLSSLMMRGRFGAEDRISTADSFLFERLAAVEPGAVFDFDGKILAEAAAKHAPEGIDPKELAAEAENFIWANDVSAEEYLDRMIDRRGMRRPVQKAEREELWRVVSAVSAELDGRRAYTKNYAAVKLIRALGAGSGAKAAASVDYVFIDEAQDLSAAVLKALKACARRCVVLAGDADQSIYQGGFSFKRSDLNISGRTRILKTNFRNTAQIHALAERYRSGEAGWDAESQPEAFRDGPPPELFQGENRNVLADLLVERIKLFTAALGYELENLCVLVPLKGDIDFLKERLGGAGYAVSNIKDKDFDFASTGSIRISTMHSSKGLDFPVVFLFFSRQPYFGSVYDGDTVERMTRNLVYVSLTRAMDHLNVFTLEEPSSPAIQGVVEAMG